MKGARFRRLLVIALGTALLTTAAFQLVLYLRIQHEVKHPSRPATTPGNIRLLPGFKLQLLHSVPGDEGTWICMTRDPQGRLIISPTKGDLLRVTLAGGKAAKIERLNQPVQGAMGLLYAANSLYLDGVGPKGRGLYREKNQGGVFGAPELLCPLSHTMFEEHAAHGVILGPEGKLYVVCGDCTALPPGLAQNSPLRNYAEDQLLPYDRDPRGFDFDLKPPGGFVLRMDLDGSHRELFAGGFRNIYTVAFNADGEMFGLDNDDDTDMGTDWYRPVPVIHCVSGGDYGYRYGTGKFPYYYEDRLPATLKVGLGAPTGLKFAPANCLFPPSYRDAGFAEDWAYGRLLAVHLIAHGAGYDATLETVLRGKPLTLTALEFGLDGALYFITGGYETASGLYRLSYDGPKREEQPETKARQAAEEAARAARRLRRQLESFHDHRDLSACDVLWPSLGSPDRWIRYAARVALEFQDVAGWKNRALAETDSCAGLTALLALARCGGPETQPDLLRALDKFPFSGLTEDQELSKLRVMEVSFIRQGRPSDALARRAIEALDPLYPAAADNVNHELCQLLLYLQAPAVVAKTMALLDQAPTQEEQTYYVMRLRDITNGWTPDLRKDYLGWFHKKRDPARHRPEIQSYFHNLDIEYSDGPSFELYLEDFLGQAAATLSDSERKALAAYLPKPPLPAPPAAPGRKFVKQWRMADLEPRLARLKEHRSRARGRLLFTQSQCVLCHRMANKGGSVGPDLTAVSSRLAPRGILESILEPSKVLPEQYQNILLTLRDGDVLTGRVMAENDQRLLFMTDLIHRTVVEVRKADVESRRASKISPMPEGLVNSLTEDEIWDLIAFLESGGSRKIAGTK
jgi:putative heme-binding domain-containing protein